MTTVTKIVASDPSGRVILTTLTSDRCIKAEGHNLTTVTRIVAFIYSSYIYIYRERERERESSYIAHT